MKNRNATSGQNGGQDKIEVKRSFFEFEH